MTCAADVDSEGRRQGGPDPGDTNADVTEKDVLPAYEVKGGPQNCGQFPAVDSGTDTNSRLQTAEATSVGTFSRSQLAETSSGTINPSNQLSPTSDVHLSLPLPPSYSPVTATTRPITPSTNP